MCTLQTLYSPTGPNFFTVPGPPASVAVVDHVVIWQAPQSPNGNLTGYSIRVYSDTNMRSINVGANTLYYKLTIGNLPTGDNLRVQVIVIFDSSKSDRCYSVL